MVKLSKEYRPLAKRYMAKGWQLEATNGGHVRWIGPNGQTVISACTPSDWRAKKQLEARLKRADKE
jgi:predicted RNA binding protein YcfA (HicA-like mRNA interferase family)